jgi:tetratricopeptide (TPR) repeat protein
MGRSCSRIFAWATRLLILALGFSAPGQTRSSVVNRARELYRSGQFAQAESLLRPLLAAEPDNAQAHLLLGESLAMQSERSGAIDELSAAVRLKPDSAEVYNTLGTVLARFLENGPAQEAFTRAVELDPQLVDAHVSLALLLAQSGDLNGAAQHLEAAIHLEQGKPGVALPHYLQGKIYLQQSDYRKASGEFQAALSARPGYAEAWFLLGKARRAQLDDGGALTAFRRAAELLPQDFNAQYELGSEYLSQGKVWEASVCLKKALAISPNDWATLYKLQRALRQAGETAAANRYDAELRQLVHQDDQANLHSMEAKRNDDEGVALEQQGDLSGALEKYRTASELVPDQDGYRLNFALALCRLNRWDEGIAEIREIVRRDPNNADAQRALFIAEDKAKSRHSSDGSAPDR